ncbi:hypothetical protein C414_000470005 [Campylobacter jejuni subsp. jejuni 414]|nr:hypothetical protein C414_000470005 [Campylobacter jejuni subsp. jejuni 414]
MCFCICNPNYFKRMILASQSYNNLCFSMLNLGKNSKEIFMQNLKPK